MCSLLLLCSVLVLCSYQEVHAQKDKRLIQADSFFSRGDYITAAGLYDQFLKTDPRKIQQRFPVGSHRNQTGITGTGLSENDVVYKKAESYRLAHYLNEAIQTYGEAYANDSVKYADALYWRAVCMRSLLKTDSATIAIDQYLKAKGGSSSLRQAAEKEKATIAYVHAQVKRADTVLYTITKINSASGSQKGIYAPVPEGNGAWVVTSTAFDSAAREDQNPYHNRLFTARVQDGTFTTLDPTSFEQLDASYNQGAACLSADGSVLYLTQWRNDTKGKHAGIYKSERKGNQWTTPVLFTALQTVAANYQQPALSQDGRTLYFASDRSGGLGKLDIWYALLSADGGVEGIYNPGSQVNTPEDDQAPFYHNLTGVLYFSSKGRIGLGGYDLFSTLGSGDSWKEAVNLGYPVNSTRDDVYFYAGAEGLRRNALFCSDRGSGCCLETYTLEKRPKKRKLTGKVVDCDGAAPLEGAVVSWKEEGGKTATTTAGVGGVFSFELNEEDDPDSLIVSKDEYQEKIASLVIASRNEEDLLIDILNNEDLCLIDKDKVIDVEQVITLYFDFDKSNIRKAERKILDSVANVLLADTAARVQISGYTDGKGTDEYNKSLGEDRAVSAAKYLQKKGVDKSRISFESFGECCPVEEEITADGKDNPEARQKNRRALVYIRR